MLGSGDFLKTTVSMGLGVLVGAVVIAQVLSSKVGENRPQVAGRLAPDGIVVGPDGRPDPFVTGSVRIPGGGQTIILDPCTGMRKN